MKQRYDSYKPSGIEWIGEIPSHWDVCRVKDCFTLKTGTTPKGFDKPIIDEEVNWFTPSDIERTGTILKESERKLSKDLIISEGISLFPKDSLIFVGIGATAGKLGYASIEGYSNQQITGLIPKKCVSKYYFYYLCQDSNRVRDNATFTTLPIINNSYLSQVYWLLPPLEEQEAIAAWLDEKCGEIDAAIAKVDREIELIDELKQSEISRVVTRGFNSNAKLRPSGIDWIREIPEHWTIKPLKYVVSYNDEVWPENSKDDFCIKYVEIGDVSQTSGVNNYTEYEFSKAPSRARRIVRKDDVIVSTVRTYLKAIAKVREDNLTVSTGFMVLRAKGINPSYLGYLTLGDHFIQEIISKSVGVSYPAINSTEIANIKVLIPPLSEQHEIADCLDKKCAEIDRLKAKLKKKRDTLVELRQSLISEVVTGKKKVV